MRYQIKRECWSSNTYNGYEDNPYWLIQVNHYTLGLSDDGKFWSIINGVSVNTDYVREELLKIIQECKLNITLQ